jgi:predicted nucleotidyltransferase
MVKNPDTKDDILNCLLQQRTQLAALGVASIGLFGSFVRGEQTTSSDIDILVEFAPDLHTFDNFMELSFLLEDLLGRKVDMVTPEALSPYIGPYILKEVERVAIAA